MTFLISNLEGYRNGHVAAGPHDDPAARPPQLDVERKQDVLIERTAADCEQQK
jgi:hypothetical protein